MENNNLPVNEPVTEPAVDTAQALTEEVLTAETPLTEGDLSKPVLSDAASFTTPETAPVQPEAQAYTPPTVELPTLESTAAPTYQQPQVVYVQQPVYAQQPTQQVYSQQPIYVQQPVYVQQQAPAQSSKGRGASIAALVLGIISIVSCLFMVLGFFSVLCGILGLIFAIVAFAKKRSGAMTIIGLILSILGLLIGGLLSVACVEVISEDMYYYDDGYYSYDYYDYEDYDYFA